MSCLRSFCWLFRIQVVLDYLHSHWQPWLKRDIQSILDEPAPAAVLEVPYISLHVRRGDKLKTDTAHDVKVLQALGGSLCSYGYLLLPSVFRRYGTCSTLRISKRTSDLSVPVLYYAPETSLEIVQCPSCPRSSRNWPYVWSRKSFPVARHNPPMFLQCQPRRRFLL